MDDIVGRGQGPAAGRPPAPEQSASLPTTPPPATPRSGFVSTDVARQLTDALVAERAENLRLRTEFNDVLDDVLKLTADIEEIVGWIVNVLGYPIDMSTTPPVPERWRRRIEDAWIEQDGISEDEADMIRQTIAEEGRWA